MENIENLESVKSMAKPNFKMCLVINIQGFNDKDVVQILYRSKHFVLSWKINLLTFHILHTFHKLMIMGKLDLRSEFRETSTVCLMTTEAQVWVFSFNDSHFLNDIVEWKWVLKYEGQFPTL